LLFHNRLHSNTRSSNGGNKLPSAISSNGRKVNALEGFARYFPLAASYLSGNNNDKNYHDNKKNRFDVLFLMEGILRPEQTPRVLSIGEKPE